jgi:hypothetical protein
VFEQFWHMEQCPAFLMVQDHRQLISPFYARQPDSLFIHPQQVIAIPKSIYRKLEIAQRRSLALTGQLCKIFVQLFFRDVLGQFAKMKALLC